ncbi:MAG: LiaF-related protein [Clostridia bacterium]|nr:LiaF-related protein [Clostridia bacterium]
MKKIGNALWGIIFIVIGLILALNAFGITDINIFFAGWWTLFIIIPCFIGLFKSNNKTGDIIGVLIGVTLLLAAQGILSFDIIRKLAIPAILLVIGLCILFGQLINKKVSEKVRELNKNDKNEYYATFGEQKVDLSNQEFLGATLNAVFGGVTYDIRNAIINKDEVINASAIFGGITIIVPSNVNVVVKSTPIFGGVSNKSLKNADANAKTVYVNGVCMFGGIDIK